MIVYWTFHWDDLTDTSKNLSNVSRKMVIIFWYLTNIVVCEFFLLGSWSEKLVTLFQDDFCLSDTSFVLSTKIKWLKVSVTEGHTFEPKVLIAFLFYLQQVAILSEKILVHINNLLTKKVWYGAYRMVHILWFIRIELTPRWTNVCRPETYGKVFVENPLLGCLRLRALAEKTGFGSMKIGFRLAFYEMVLDLSSLVRDRNSLTSFFSISRLIITLRHLIISHYISPTPPPTRSKRSKILISKLKFCLFFKKKNTKWKLISILCLRSFPAQKYHTRICSRNRLMREICVYWV